MNVDIQVYDRELVDLLGYMKRSGEDLSPVMRDISEVLRAGIELSFDRQADPNTGAPWKPLHPLTILERQEQGTWPGKILQRSGRLVSSMVPDHGADYAAAGSNVVYAGIQNFGGTIRPKTKGALKFGGGLFGQAVIPARPWAGIWPESLAEILDMLGRFVLPEQ